MTAARVVLPLLLALLAALPAAAAQAAAEPEALEVGVGEVRVGDSGYAVTAGAGNVLERFDVEVLGVQHGGGNGFPLVLVRTSGPFIERVGGVAAGMSGSPVYLSTEEGDALLGAIGYVFPNADHQLALVTPIASMREAGGRATGLPPVIPGYGPAQSVATPILLAGADQRAASLLGELFTNPQLVPFPAQAAGSAPAALDEEYEPVPGSAVAVALVSGDVQLSAVGTLTTVEEEGLLAFGHPLLNLGAAELPLVPAYVTAIVSSSEVPFKLANVGSRVLGVIEQDRPTAIAGRLGVEPQTIDVSLTIDGPMGERRHELRVAADERLFPVLVATATLQLLDRALAATGAGFAELAWEVGLRGGERVNVLEQVSHPADIAFAAAQLAGGPLAVLASNVYRQPEVERVQLVVRLEERQRVASLEEAVLEAEEIEAGAAAHVHLRLQPHREAAVVRTVTVPLPESLTGQVTLLIRGGGEPRATGDLDLDEQEIDVPRSFGELLDALRVRVQASELVVEAVSETGELSRLLRAPFPFVVTGHERVELTVLPAEAPALERDGGAPAEEQKGEPKEGSDVER